VKGYKSPIRDSAFITDSIKRITGESIYRMEEMKSNGNTWPMIVFKIARNKCLGGGILLNKGWDWNWKSDSIKQAQAIKNNEVKSAIARQLWRNGYDKHLEKVEVKNGRWRVKGYYYKHHTSNDYFNEDVSDLLK